MAKTDEYDLEDIYDAEIAPLMTKVIEICKKRKMPMFATFVYAYDPATNDDSVCTTNLPFENERETPEAFKALFDTIRPRRSPVMRLTARNKDGQITDQTVILP